MAKVNNKRLKDMCNENLFSLLDEQTKRIIARDMEDIYEEKVSLADSEKPWIFQQDK